MSLDIKYRPRVYADVLGQDATIGILREFVRSGRGFQQSYLFCGERGTGKTTLGRILARALLCEAPSEGSPCDKCHSCRGLLETETSADFTEVDAATNSGKADVAKIKDEIPYATFSGKRRIYLFDEAHQLTKDALDALLKPMEDTFPGSADKKLTCIFCTTEPEKMRDTILSRCAPAFVIQMQKPEHIAQRLQMICEKEGIEADPEMLRVIAETTGCHIRDALKAVEGVSMLGGITRENVTSYLHLDMNAAYIETLSMLGTDIQGALAKAKSIMQRVSPATCYAKFAEVAMLGYQVSLGDTVAGTWGADAFRELSAKGEVLLGYASRFASRPGRPSAAMLLMDLATLHHGAGAVRRPDAVLQVQQVGAAPAPVTNPTPASPPSAPARATSEAPATSSRPEPSSVDPSNGTVPERDREWVVDPRLINHQGRPPQGASSTPNRGTRVVAMDPAEFARYLSLNLVEMGARFGRPA